MNLCRSWSEAIKHAIKTALPKVTNSGLRARDVSARTKSLFNEKSKMSKRTHTSADFAAIADAIKESSLQDYRDWVRRCVEDMEEANSAGDV